MQRPDLSKIDPEVLAYIEFLEKKASLRTVKSTMGETRQDDADLAPERASQALPAEQETAVNMIIATREGLAKRTNRHLFTRQHRGGMGVFAIDIDASDFPAVLVDATENQSLLVFTSRARVFRLPVNAITSTAVFAKGSLVTERFGLEPDESLVAVLPEQAKGYVALASAGGRVRCLRHHLFGEHMKPGTEVYKYGEFGTLASACWTPGDAELFLLTQKGMGIRFNEKALSPQGDQGIRLAADDRVVSVTSVYPESAVFMLGVDGRGTIRLMSGFAANKSVGGSGKIAFRSSKAVGAVTTEVNDDIFIISKLGKIIRFPADEVSSTDGVVQGVNCISLRGDEPVSLLKSGPIY